MIELLSKYYRIDPRELPMAVLEDLYELYVGLNGFDDDFAHIGLMDDLVDILGIVAYK